MKNSSKKPRFIGYWITTILLCFGMFSGAIAQLVHFRPNVEGMQRLGYPLYMLSIIAPWKLLGVVALLMPGATVVKEWAYAGFFFLLTGAVLSHIAAGDRFLQYLGPLTFLILTVISWFLRPASRRLAATVTRVLNRDKSFALQQ